MINHYKNLFKNANLNRMKTSFQEAVYDLTKKIPEGKVATYGQLAHLAGNPKAARAVGMLMATNRHAPVVPCHRVVAANGELTGYSAGQGLVTKQQMLQEEGVVFANNRVDLSASQWLPTNL